MSMLKKYLIDFVVIILLLFFYIVYTDHGQKNFYKLISYSASNKAGLDVDILSLNLHQYPYVKSDILVEDKYKIHLHGFVSDLFSERKFDMQYTLQSDTVQNKLTRIKGVVDINGTLKGKRKYTTLSGQGRLLDGEVSYSLIKDKKIFKDVNLILKDINSSKLLEILDQKAIFNGTANAKLHFDTISKKNKKGRLEYKVADPKFHGHPTHVDAVVDIIDDQHIFNIDLAMPELKLSLLEGKYNQEKKKGHAQYTLNISDLSAFEKELGSKFIGEFTSTGELTHDKHIHITGTSKSLGGLLALDYNKTLLNVTLENIPFSSLLDRMSMNSILEANTTGNIRYETKQREMQSQLTLHDTKILASRFTQDILKKFDYNLSKEKFTESKIDASLKNKVFSSKIILANEKHHLVLTDTKIDTDKKIIDTYIDLKTPIHFLEGKLYARLDEYITKDYYLKFNGLAEKHYKVKLDGLINSELVNMDYAIQAKRFPSHVCTIEDKVNLEGHINGPFSRLRIRGKGTALDGLISYDGIKKSKHFEDVTLQLENVHARKLSTLLGVPDYPTGKVDITANFIHANKDEYEGDIEYIHRNKNYKMVPLHARTNIQVNEQKQTFTSSIQLGDTSIDLSQGQRDANTDITSAFFTVNSRNLTQLETLLGTKYTGSFYAMGNISYKDDIQIRGLTKTFGGMIDFQYKDDFLIIDMEKSSLKRILSLFASKPLLDASTIGSINYDYKKELLTANAKLVDAKFLHSKLTHNVFDKSGIDMLKESFPHSTLYAHYQNKILNGNIRLKSDTSYFMLEDIYMDNKNKGINANFHIKMQEQEFNGKVYGTTEDPKINLDMQKLLKYQVDKQLDTYMGEGNRKLMESMPMGNTAKDMATDIGGSFMDMFF